MLKIGRVAAEWRRLAFWLAFDDMGIGAGCAFDTGIEAGRARELKWAGLGGGDVW